MAESYCPMPTNVTPQYRKAEEAYKAATTTEEKIERLEEMMALLPKHKGTDHLFGDLKKRLSKLKRQAESGGRKGRSGPTLGFEREGAAQVILVGAPNSGKSSILAALTKARPDVADYPFTTHHPQPGMIPYEDIQIQLVDTPPVTADAMPVHVMSLVHGSDAAIIVADLSSDQVLEDVEAVMEAFTSRRVDFVRELPAEREIGHRPVRALVFAAKRDAQNADERLQLLREMICDSLEIVPVSVNHPQCVAELPESLFRFLGIIRVYSKTPGKKPELEKPFTLFAGQTVEDVCALVHKDFVANLSFARLWRDQPKPVTVSRDEKVVDGDILELHV